MDKFSELISKGVAKFNYVPTNPDKPDYCEICRTYNNLFGVASQTHMSTLPDGRKVITGQLVGNKSKFDSFMCRSTYGGIDFTSQGWYGFVNFMSKYGLVGSYSILNGDSVYILEPGKEQSGNEEGTCCDCPCGCLSFTTSESIIPQSTRYLSTRCDIMDVMECKDSDPLKTAKNLNESRYVKGNNWYPVELSDGLHMVSFINDKTYIM